MSNQLEIPFVDPDILLDRGERIIKKCTSMKPIKFPNDETLYMEVMLINRRGPPIKHWYILSEFNKAQEPVEEKP